MRAWQTATRTMSKRDDDEAPKPMEHPPVLPDKGRYDGPAHASPYALSRLAPSYALVDMAEQIAKADEQVATVTSGKLGVIAEQIKKLQDQAHALLERARRDAELHRARCSFEKKPGGVYHLYRKEDGERWFSLLAPEEWVTPQAQTFEGSYRLDLDMSFTRLDVREDDGVRPDLEAIRALLGR